MKIETKFNIGDYVYKLGQPSVCFRVHSLAINDRGGIIYHSQYIAGNIYANELEEELGLLIKPSETGSAPPSAAEEAPAPQPRPHDPTSGTPKKRPWYRRD